MFRECCLGADALGVVASDDEDLRSGINADTELVEQVRCPLHDKLLDHGHEFLDLLVEGKPVLRDRSQRMTDRIVWGFQRARAQRSAVTGEHSLRLLGRLSAELFRCAHDHRFEGDHRCRGIFNRGVMGDFQPPDHLHGPVGGLQERCCEPCEHSSGCVFRIERVGLPVESVQAPAWSGDLDDLVTVASQERGETSP